MAEFAEKVPAACCVVLLSGGLDSATALAIARSRGLACHTMAVDYNQRHRHELTAAEAVARQLGAASHRTIKLDLRAFGGSALTSDVAVPKDRDQGGMSSEIPVTYVPARNLIFISLAAALAETLGAGSIYLGVNAVDYSGYPDCRPEFLKSLQETIVLGTKAGSEGHAPRLEAPLVQMSKAEIIRTGTRLGVDYGLTHSCYDPVIRDGVTMACGHCDSCLLRKQGFVDAGVPDPTRYL